MIRVQVWLVEEQRALTNQIATQQERSHGAQNIPAISEELAAAQFPAGYDAAWMGPRLPQRAADGRRRRKNLFAIHGECSDETDGRMLLGDAHHFFHAVGIKPIIGKYKFAVFGFGRNLPDGVVVVFDDPEEAFVVDYANSRILGCILFGNCQRLVGAAIVHNGVIPIGIGLPQNALDTLRQMGGAVVSGREDANAR